MRLSRSLLLLSCLSLPRSCGRRAPLYSLALYAYADDIGAWFGNKVQEAAD